MEEIELKNRNPGEEEEKQHKIHETRLDADDPDDAQYQDLPRNHALHKMWGRIKQQVNADPLVARNEKVNFLAEHLDIKVYRDCFSRLLLDNIEIGRDRRGEDSYLEYREHKVYVKRGETWEESRNPLNKKFIVEFNKLVAEIKSERLNSPAGEIERLLNLEKTNPEEKKIEWFAEREVEDVKADNVKSRLQTVLDYLQENQPQETQKINDLKLDISNLNNNKKPETQIGKDLLNKEIESLKKVNRVQEYLKKNFGGLLVLVSVFVGATTALVFLLKKQLHKLRHGVHKLRIENVPVKTAVKKKTPTTKQTTAVKSPPPVIKITTHAEKKLPKIIDVPMKHIENGLVHTTNNIWLSFLGSVCAGYVVYRFTKKN